MKSSSIMLVICLLHCTLYAQQKSTTGNSAKPGNTTTKYYLKNVKNLDSLSDAFLNVGDDEFIVIDAYKDGLIKTNNYSFEFDNKILTLNRKPVPEPYNSRYLEKINHIIKTGKFTSLTFTIGPGAGNDDVSVREPQNYYVRKTYFAPGQSLPTDNYNDSMLLHILYANHIINNNADEVSIHYTKTAFYVNNVKLENANLLNSCIPLAEKVNGGAPANELDEFNIHYSKTALERYFKN